MNLEPLTSLTAQERSTYAAIIDDILAKHSKALISGDRVLERLQNRLLCDFTSQQRSLVRLLIIERLKQLPVPQTIARSGDRDAALLPVMAGTATIAVLNVPELLEAIISHLPMKDLVVTSRVNKAFHRLLATSPTLQRRLFLLPGRKPATVLAAYPELDQGQVPRYSRRVWEHRQQSSRVRRRPRQTQRGRTHQPPVEIGEIPRDGHVDQEDGPTAESSQFCLP
jgi:hypothetical protein